MSDSNPPPDIMAILDREVQEVVDTLQLKPDLLVVLLRFHLLSESFLDRLIGKAMPKGTALAKNGNLTFAQKLAIIEALEVLSAQAVDGLRQLNRVRNDCAHTKGRRVLPEDIDRIGRTLGGLYSKHKKDYGHSPEALAVGTLGLLYRVAFGEALTILLADDIKAAALAALKKNAT